MPDDTESSTEVETRGQILALIHDRELKSPDALADAILAVIYPESLQVEVTRAWVEASVAESKRLRMEDERDKARAEVERLRDQVARMSAGNLSYAERTDFREAFLRSDDALTAALRDLAALRAGVAAARAAIDAWKPPDTVRGGELLALLPKEET
jgi:hypothetical protein